MVEPLLIKPCTANAGQTGLEFTRSRPYRKNDQAWVEQKNGAVVRKLAGYHRLSGIADAEKLARLYEPPQTPGFNAFQPEYFWGR
jgi:hypothetical protein